MIINIAAATANNKRIEKDINRIAESIVTGKIEFKYLLFSDIIVQKKIAFSISCGWKRETTPVTTIKRKDIRDISKNI
jgi:hypothetical protein